MFRRKKLLMAVAGAMLAGMAMPDVRVGSAEPLRSVIIDTDLGSSMDDLFTVDFSARMHKAGKLNLMAVMMDRPDRSDQTGAGEFLKFADCYLASLGLEDLPIGKSMPLAEERLPVKVFNPYWTLVHSNRVTGEGGPLTLTDADPPKGAAFYEVEVTRP